MTSSSRIAEQKKYLTAAEVGRMLRWEIDERKAKRRLRNVPAHLLPYQAVGRGRLYMEADVYSYIESRRVA